MSPPSLDHLRRYAPLLEADEIDAFVEAARRPLPRVVWANPLRGDPVETAREVEALWPTATPLGWCDFAWRLPPDAQPGHALPFLLGRLHAQEEAALFAARALGAQRGERVLDLCAAPGNKTARLAVEMGDRGLVVANDVSAGRLPGLRRVVERLGLTSIAVTRGDAARLPGKLGAYDRVLADVPCSGEGTSRKVDGRTQGDDPAHRAAISALQARILARALQLVRPGGVVVYATCTYAPEENEAVLHSVPPELATIEPLVNVGLGGRPVTRGGVTAWGGRTFRSDVAHAARFWPHVDDTGGFFVARLRRRVSLSNDCL